MPKSEDEIEINAITQEEMNESIDSSTGLTSNGITHTLPTVSGKKEYFFLEEGRPIPDKYKRMMVENAEMQLKSVPKQHRSKLRSNIESWRKELGIK